MGGEPSGQHSPEPYGPLPPRVEKALRALRDDLRARYAETRPNSHSLHRRALAVLPGGNSRSQLHFTPYPSYVVRGEGPLITDVDGFHYIDLLNNYTSLVHGHPGSEFIARLQKQLSEGTAFGAPTYVEVEMAEELCRRVRSLERIRFTNSGTEACLYAIRTARAFTGRHDIIKVQGGYHGGSDALQINVSRIGAPGESLPEMGVPPAAAAGTHVIPFNDADRAEEVIRRVGPRSAALIVEPMQGAAGALPADGEYLRVLRRATREVGCLLIFDEIMTLRLAFGGAQQLYGVSPDVTTMGKIIGGGFPIGAFAGRAEVMDVLDPRIARPLRHTGTFNANPVSLLAGLIAMRRLTAERISDINARGDRIRDLVNKQAERDGLAFSATGIGSILQIHPGREAPFSFLDAARRPSLPLECLFLLLLLDGVFIAPRGMLNISTAIDEEEQDRIESVLEKSLETLRAFGVERVSEASN